MKTKLKAYIKWVDWYILQKPVSPITDIEAVLLVLAGSVVGIAISAFFLY